ncbi:MAG: release factor glutamine methyltransferase [Bacteroidia bacterium]|jgi:release factor glutamine methyltransferase
MLRQFLKRIVYPILKPFSTWYFSKPRNYSYNGLKVRVNPGVFFPHLTISTKVFLQSLDEQKLDELSVLELGAGCGIMSFRCAQLGANVTASDISLAAIENLEHNQKKLGLDVQIVHSDLFDSITEQFDLILINPPYYPKNPTTEAEKAWFCGEDFQYFKKLSKQLNEHLTQDGFALMILSEDCQIDTIEGLFEKSQIKMEEVWAVNKFGEQNFIFKLTR